METIPYENVRSALTEAHKHSLLVEATVWAGEDRTHLVYGTVVRLTDDTVEILEDDVVQRIRLNVDLLDLKVQKTAA